MKCQPLPRDLSVLHVSPDAVVLGRRGLPFGWDESGAVQGCYITLPKTGPSRHAPGSASGGAGVMSQAYRFQEPELF
jgi:hypothetical protein